MQACWSQTGPIVALRPSASLRDRLNRMSTGKAQSRRRNAQAFRVLMGSAPKERVLPALTKARPEGCRSAGGDQL